MDAQIMLTWGRVWWPLFLLISSAWVFLGFGVPETLALLTSRATHTDNTLSNYSWTELHVSSTLTVHTIAWWASLTVWATFAIVITLHIWFRQIT